MRPWWIWPALVAAGCVHRSIVIVARQPTPYACARCMAQAPVSPCNVDPPPSFEAPKPYETPKPFESTSGFPAPSAPTPAEPPTFETPGAFPTPPSPCD
jgi:hypothetical protein